MLVKFLFRSHTTSRLIRQQEVYAAEFLSHTSCIVESRQHTVIKTTSLISYFFNNNIRYLDLKLSWTRDTNVLIRSEKHTKSLCPPTPQCHQHATETLKMITIPTRVEKLRTALSKYLGIM